MSRVEVVTVPLRKEVRNRLRRVLAGHSALHGLNYDRFVEAAVDAFEDGRWTPGGTSAPRDRVWLMSEAKGATELLAEMERYQASGYATEHVVCIEPVGLRTAWATFLVIAGREVSP